MDAGLLLEPFIAADPNLRLQSVVPRIHRGANQGRELRIDQRLPADNRKHSLAARIGRAGIPHQVKLAPLHGNRWKLNTSSASRFNRAAERFMISMSFLLRASCSIRSKYDRAARSSTAERFSPTLTRTR